MMFMAMFERKTCYQRPLWADEEGSIDERLSQIAKERGHSTVENLLAEMSARNNMKESYKNAGGNYDPKNAVISRLEECSLPYHKKLALGMKMLSIPLTEFSESIGISALKARHILSGSLLPSTRIMRRIEAAYGIKPKK